MPDNTIADFIWTADLFLLRWWLIAMIIAMGIIGVFAFLRKLDVTFSERTRLRVAGVGYWGTLALAAFCMIIQPLMPASARPQNAMQSSSMATTPALPATVPTASSSTCQPYWLCK